MGRAMSEPVLATGRRVRRGREAHSAVPDGEGARPVWPGVEGGRFKPLTPVEELAVHEAVLHLLEKKRREGMLKKRRCLSLHKC